MKKLEIATKHRGLIESIICQNPKFDGNEHLINEFCELIYKKSYLLIDTIKDAVRLKKHLYRICDECLDQIIAQKGNPNTKYAPKETLQTLEQLDSVVNRTRYNSSDISIETAQRGISNIKQDIIEQQEYDNVKALPDPLKIYPARVVSKGAIDKLMFIIKDLSDKYPTKKYFEIFSLRYIKMLNHTETAQKLKISQIELSRRFVEMIKLARESV